MAKLELRALGHSAHVKKMKTKMKEERKGPVCEGKIPKFDDIEINSISKIPVDWSKKRAV